MLKEMNLKFLTLGDFNLRSNYSKPLFEFCSNHNIKQLIHTPTRQHYILDLIFANESNAIIGTKVYDANIADHHVTECTLNLRRPSVLEKSFLVRNYKNINTHLAQQLVDNRFNESTITASDVISKTVSIFDIVAPQHTKIHKTKTSPVQVSKSTKKTHKTEKCALQAT